MRFGLLAFFSTSSLLALGGCFGGGVLEAADCCVCLLSHDIDGNKLPPQSGDANNCVAGDGDYEAENQQCSDEAAQQIVSGDSPIVVSAASCIDSCASACGDFTLTTAGSSDGGPDNDAG